MTENKDPTVQEKSVTVDGVKYKIKVTTVTQEDCSWHVLHAANHQTGQELELHVKSFNNEDKIKETSKSIPFSRDNFLRDEYTVGIGIAHPDLWPTFHCTLRVHTTKPIRTSSQPEVTHSLLGMIAEMLLIYVIPKNAENLCYAVQISRNGLCHAYSFGGDGKRIRFEHADLFTYDSQTPIIP